MKKKTKKENQKKKNPIAQEEKLKGLFQVFSRYFFPTILPVILTVWLTVFFTSYHNNQQREKNEKKEKINMIKDLESVLREDSVHITNVLEITQQAIVSIEFLLNHSEYKFYNIEDSIIDYHIHFASHAMAFRPKTSVFETYRYSDKLKLLKNNTLTSLFTLHDIKYKRIMDLIESDNDVIFNKIDPFLLNNAQFIGFSKPSYTIKIDRKNVNDLLKQDKFKHLLNYNKIIKELIIDSDKETLIVIRQVLKELETERNFTEQL
jgi:hypothetical protein